MAIVPSTPLAGNDQILSINNYVNVTSVIELTTTSNEQSEYYYLGLTHSLTQSKSASIKHFAWMLTFLAINRKFIHLLCTTSQRIINNIVSFFFSIFTSCISFFLSFLRSIQSLRENQRIQKKTPIIHVHQRNHITHFLRLLLWHNKKQISNEKQKLQKGKKQNTGGKNVDQFLFWCNADKFMWYS